MRHLFTLSHHAIAAFRAQCSGERLGWCIFKNPYSFSQVHRIELHAEEGPVIIMCQEVWAVDDPDAVEVYGDREAAIEAYWRSLAPNEE